MANPYHIQQQYEFAGLDLSKVEVVRPVFHASDLLNFTLDEDESGVARKGFKARCNHNNLSVFGLHTYRTKALGEKELLVISQELYRLKEGSLNITAVDVGESLSTVSGRRAALGIPLIPDGDINTENERRAIAGLEIRGIEGTVDSIDVSITVGDEGSVSFVSTLTTEEGRRALVGAAPLPDGAIDSEFDRRSIAGVTTPGYVGGATSGNKTWIFTIKRNNEVYFQKDLGSGFELSPYTLAQLVIEIEATTGFSASVTGDDTLPAAWLPLTQNDPFSDEGTIAISFYQLEKVCHPDGAANPFYNSYINRANDRYSNVSTVESDDNVYFANGHDSLVKYDGVSCYKAGMPQGALTSTVVGSGGALSGDYKYHITYIQKDANGNIVEGIRSNVSGTVSPSSQEVDVTVPNLQPSSGYLTDCAIVNGTQLGVNTITVASGNTLQVGQTAYVLDGISSGYVERLITASSDTSITIDGAPINVSDLSPISANLRIAIYRTKASGSDRFLVAEIPNNSTVATTVYADGAADAIIEGNGQYLEPVAQPSTPPIGRYLSKYRGSLIIASDEAVYFSDIDSPEYFPSNFSFNVSSRSNAPITGISRGDRFFWIFKDREAYLVNGDLTSGQFTVDSRSETVGCVAHDTIREIDGHLIWLGHDAFYHSFNGTAPSRISDQISPLFFQRGYADNYIYRFKQATAIYDHVYRKYLCFFPATTTAGADKYANTNSIVIVFDVARAFFPKPGTEPRTNWYKWDTLNSFGGFELFNDNLWWGEWSYNTSTSNMLHTIYKRLDSGTNEDYWDHLSPIDWFYITGWESLGAPSVPKKFQRAVIRADNLRYSPSGSMRLQSEKDYIAGSPHTITDLSFSGSGAGGWSNSYWAYDAWGSPSASSLAKTRLKTGKAGAMRFRLQHSEGGVLPIISGLELEIVAPYNPNLRTDYG